MRRVLLDVLAGVAVALTCIGAVLVLAPFVIRGALAGEDRA